MSIVNGLLFALRRRLPIMQQTQAAECGMVCIGMIANYYGHEIDLISLRRKFSTSLKGATLADVMRMAHQTGMVSRALRLELDELNQLRRPCILHWELNHFVVLKKVNRQSITIHDPARGVRDVPMDEVSRCFTGVALELLPSANFQRISEKQSISMRSLIGSVTGFKSFFVQILILSVSLELFAILLPFYMQWVTDQVITTADHDLLNLLGIGFVLVVISQNLITTLRSWVTTWFSSSLSVQWKANVFSRLLALPMTWFEDRHVGDIMSRVGSINTIQSTLTNRFISTILDGMMAIVTLCMLFVYNRMLACLVLGIFAAYGVIRFIFYRPFRQANEEQLIASARADTQILETIRGVQAIKLNNKQELRLATYSNAVVDAANKGIVIQRLSIGFSTLQGLISGVGRIVLIWLAAQQVLEGNFSVGMLVAFISFADQFMGRGSGLIDAFIDFRMLKLHGERLADIVLTDVEEDSFSMPARKTEGQTSGPEIGVNNLQFRYSDSEPFVLENCSFTISGGESVAIVGPSGQGKTTLAKLLVGLLKPTSGSITIAGKDINHTGLFSHRERIGCVMQDDILFAGSISDNISFFAAQVDHERITYAAKIAQIHDDIEAMPMGYQSFVGDMGTSLSGGQIQRLLLARALYRQPDILVLDEASSHLDIERERLINQEISAMPVTRIIIAHRPETIKSADRILLLNGGVVTETNYSSLMKLTEMS